MRAFSASLALLAGLTLSSAQAATVSSPEPRTVFSAHTVYSLDVFQASTSANAFASTWNAIAARSDLPFGNFAANLVVLEAEIDETLSGVDGQAIDATAARFKAQIELDWRFSQNSTLLAAYPAKLRLFSEADGLNEGTLLASPDGLSVECTQVTDDFLPCAQFEVVTDVTEEIERRREKLTDQIKGEIAEFKVRLRDDFIVPPDEYDAIVDRIAALRAQLKDIESIDPTDIFAAAGLFPGSVRGSFFIESLDGQFAQAPSLLTSGNELALTGAAVPTAPVPVPSTAGLALLAFAALGGLKRWAAAARA